MSRPPRSTSTVRWRSTIAHSAWAAIRAEMSSGAMPRSWSRAMRASAPATKRDTYGSHSAGRCSCSPCRLAASMRIRPLRLTTATKRPIARRSSRRGSPAPSKYGTPASYMSVNACWISRSITARLLAK